ncbi:double-stranded RNA-specific editase 1 isoform X1 [Trichogramma pretiosum]|uniref:double-stranded RNA-specific editase 1 isoform X1 n=2 Tax=Trichogramma pretiosum TaxID=7493 RepID=UPI0006C9CC5A|nr:double-stranded RNA-specific editase 1 isoform X1 [Trichogramma pretiosum]
MYTRSRMSQQFNDGTPQRPQNQQFQVPTHQVNTTSFKQQTHQQQAVRTPQPKQQPPPNMQPQQQVNMMGTPQRLKPILKTSPGTNPHTSQVQPQNQNQLQLPELTNEDIDFEDGQEGMDNESQDVPKWRRKTPGLKVNRKLKRLRMNQRLRKTLQPKNAIMVLNEMKTGVQFTFPETQANLPSSIFLVHAEIDGKTYVGQGLSKPLARQNAAENALKSLLLEKMTAAAMKARLDAENEAASSNNSMSTEASVNKEAENMETNEEVDEIPWSSLASFALYKLFLEWQNQGTVVPVPRPGISPNKIKKEMSKTVTQKELPPNATLIHPVMLLNQMRPGVTYNEVCRVGNPPNTMFTLGTEIDGKEYTGAAKNKKDAKKMAAKSALLALYNLTYPEENEDVNMG